MGLMSVSDWHFPLLFFFYIGLVVYDFDNVSPFWRYHGWLCSWD
jgi:hypothetical protein